MSPQIADSNEVDLRPKFTATIPNITHMAFLQYLRSITTKYFILFIDICCRYAIGSKLGQGGFGAVYKATRLANELEV